MLAMSRGEMLLFAFMAIVAIWSLVKLMRARQAQLVADVQAQVDENQRKKKKAAEEAEAA